MKYRIVQIESICPSFIVEGKTILSGWWPLKRADTHEHYKYLHETKEEAYYTIAVHSGLVAKADKVAASISYKEVASYP